MTTIYRKLALEGRCRTDRCSHDSCNFRRLLRRAPLTCVCIVDLADVRVWHVRKLPSLQATTQSYKRAQVLVSTPKTTLDHFFSRRKEAVQRTKNCRGFLAGPFCESTVFEQRSEKSRSMNAGPAKYRIITHAVSGQS